MGAAARPPKQKHNPNIIPRFPKTCSQGPKSDCLAIPSKHKYYLNWLYKQQILCDETSEGLIVNRLTFLGNS
jgi:hypothetical protein